MKWSVAHLPPTACALALLLLRPAALTGASFLLPTANQALFQRATEPQFFVGTVGKPWMTGTFGCVRSDGWQMHEGLDIRCLQRDKQGEPIDPVLATADGTVAYINTRPSLSNYGNYIVVRHALDGLEIYSLYAHLSAVHPGLKTGQKVHAGEPIAVMGRTSNTRQRISKDRAHVHFELNFLVNDQFPVWFQRTHPKDRNDHGLWNGQNLIGIDPRQVLLAQRERGERFSLVEYLRTQPELCRVQVRATHFPWLKRYPALLRPNSRAEKEGAAGYEFALNFNGLPFQVIPRTATELKSKSKFHLLSVNEAEQQKNPCRRLVSKKGDHWELGPHGQALLELLTY